MVFWCLSFSKQVDLRYHSSKVEFLCSFFGGNRRHKKPFRNYLTFNCNNKSKQRNFVFPFWFLVKIWCNETIIRYKISIAATSLRTNQIYIRVYILWINLIFQVGQVFQEGLGHFIKNLRNLNFCCQKKTSDQSEELGLPFNFDPVKSCI